MKFLTLRALGLLAAISLSGCCPGGCFVLHGEAYEALANRKPVRDYWESEAATAEERRSEWIACGGDNRGVFTPRVGEVEEERRAGESTDIPAYSRLIERIEVCMFKRGYRYTADCGSDSNNERIECTMR